MTDDEFLVEQLLARSTHRELAVELISRCVCTFKGMKLISECEYHRELREKYEMGGERRENTLREGA